MNQFECVMPWPVKELSANSRAHWAVLAKAKAQYRGACKLLALAAGAKPFAETVDRTRKLDVRLEFHPPNKRRHDSDNLNYRCKALYDGVADALGIDDRHFRTSYELHDTIGGFVRITINQQEVDQQ